MDNKDIRYPIYIVSKGRYDSVITARSFLSENIDFKIVVEPQEYDSYCNKIDSKYIIKLPFSNLGLESYPARNWCWQNSIDNGFKKHFLFDDNIYGFARLNNGKRTKCDVLSALICLQDFTDRYENIAISGYNYRYFVCSETKKPFFINTHVYSGMLINNDIPYRWRLKYNEDVDLCLQALNKKWCTVLLNVYLINKVSTTTKLKGGNQTELYCNNNDNKKALKSCSLQQMWPQYVQVRYRFNRPHHFVDWKKYFNHPLIRKSSSLTKPAQ